MEREIPSDGERFEDKRKVGRHPLHGTRLCGKTCISTESAEHLMTRKESEKDSERPHYYSQFWLDIAAGRRVIGGPRTSEEGEQFDEVAEPAPLHRSLPSEEMDGSSNGHAEATAYPVTEQVPAPEEYAEPEEIDELATNDVNDLDFQEAAIEDADIPDMDLGPVDEEEDEDEDFYDEDEEEEDEDWSGRGRKKPRPNRPTKQPKRSTKREPRRGY